MNYITRFLIFAIIFSSEVLYSQNLKIGFEEVVQFPNEQFKIGNGVNFSFEHDLGPFFILKSDIGGISGITKGMQLSPGAFSFFWLQAEALFKFDYGIMHPYLGGGIAYNRIDINLGVIGNFVRDTSGYLESDKVKYSAGWNLLTGLNLNLSSRIIICGELKYNFYKPKVVSTFKNTKTSNEFYSKRNLNLDSIILLIGIKAAF